jgi:hypothetical protein
MVFRPRERQAAAASSRRFFFPLQAIANVRAWDCLAFILKLKFLQAPMRLRGIDSIIVLSMGFDPKVSVWNCGIRWDSISSVVFDRIKCSMSTVETNTIESH